MSPNALKSAATERSISSGVGGLLVLTVSPSAERQRLADVPPHARCVEAVAQHLGVDRRTVARQLAGEGTSFSALVDGMRAELFARYEAEGARRLGGVAALLGFSAPGNFSRWHRARFGTSARAGRATRAAAAPRGRSS
jgi:AraC-like DNA-binding protein